MTLSAEDNSFFVNPPALSFSRSVFLTSLSSLFFLITPVFGSVSITTPDLYLVFCFLQYSLAFFHSLHHWWRDKVLCGWTTGQVDPLRLPPLFLYYISPVLFSVGGNLIRRAITFGGHLSPLPLWKCYWRIRATVRQSRDREWEEMRLHHVYTDKRNGWHEEKEERRDVMVCLPTVSSFCCSRCGVPCTFVESVCCAGSFCLFVEGQSNIELWTRVHRLFYQCRLPGASRRHMKPHVRSP